MSVHNPPPYRVNLPVFEGPLDLLLNLIEREELDITLVSLAQVTNQYLSYLARLEDHSPDSVASFLVVAAKLLLIKSRVLLPQKPSALAEEPDDEGDDLVRQLVEYKRYREAARWLKEVESKGLKSYVRLAPTPHLQRTLELDDVTLADLVQAVRQALKIKPPAEPANGVIPSLTISIADLMDLIASETARQKEVSFVQLVMAARDRVEVIVTLLALLEMVKQLRVTMRQARLFDDILISRSQTQAS